MYAPPEHFIQRLLRFLLLLSEHIVHIAVVVLALASADLPDAVLRDVDIEDGDGFLFARGRVSASRDEAELAMGRTREQLLANRLLAEMADKPLVHRDDLVIFD